MWRKEHFDITGTRTPTSRVVQPVANRYTDYTIPAPTTLTTGSKYQNATKENEFSEFRNSKKALPQRVAKILVSQDH
jgi:hypothetical protein